ncbi:MAG: CBS domain-containing protein [Desulfobacteraceae bacterium]|nr:CBS domain-containing protein [Desulfobacteraceae bacterium]
MMTEIKKLIIPLTDYPHMPYWATLEEAIVLLNFSHESGFHTVLVFDEFYKLLGMLNWKEILRAINPKFKELSSEKIDIITSWDDNKFKMPIKDFMSPFDITVDAGDDILKVAYLLLQHDIDIIPVKESEKVLGVVRMHDIFHEITGLILQSKK